MNEKNLDELIGEVIHIACQAEVSADAQVKRQALGDIYDALASVLPVDHKKAKVEGEGEGVARRSATAEDGKVVVYKTPQHVLDFIAEIANVPFADMADPALLKKVSETHHLVPNKGEDGLTGYNKFLTADEGVSFKRFSGNGVTRLVASRRGKFGCQNSIFEIYVDHEDDYAKVLRDGNVMFYIEGETIGHSFIEKLAISSMHRYFKENRKTNEKKKRKRARKAAEKQAEAARDAEGGVATHGEEA